MKRKRITGWFALLWEKWLCPIMLALAVMIPFRSSIADWNHVPTGSMMPTILECERVFVNKLAYDLKIPLTTRHLLEWGNPERGDIVVFFSPDDGTRMVKRVIGLPGDTIEMHRNQLVVNGKPANYSALPDEHTTAFPQAERTHSQLAWEEVDGAGHPVMVRPAVPARDSFDQVTVPENQYLVLGDNRDNSMDSRVYGFVDRNAIVGRVPMVVASFDRDKGYAPRMSRWFRSLP